MVDYITVGCFFFLFKPNSPVLRRQIKRFRDQLSKDNIPPKVEYVRHGVNDRKLAFCIFYFFFFLYLPHAATDGCESRPSGCECPAQKKPTPQISQFDPPPQTVCLSQMVPHFICNNLTATSYYNELQTGKMQVKRSHAREKRLYPPYLSGSLKGPTCNIFRGSISIKNNLKYIYYCF